MATPIELDPSLKGEMFYRLQPMLLSPLSPGKLAILSEEGWIFEPKLDGYRTIAEVTEERAILHSRWLKRFSYARILDDLNKVGHIAVFDGEVVSLNSARVPDLSKLRGYSGKFIRGPVPIYFVFDLLHIDGYNITTLPLMRRKELLEEVVPDLQHVRICGYTDDGIKLAQDVLELGFEGVVAKKVDSIYTPGRRSRNWVKIKA